MSAERPYLFVGKCRLCGQLFQAHSERNVGVLEIQGRRFRVEVCDDHVRALQSEQDAAKKVAHP